MKHPNIVIELTIDVAHASRIGLAVLVHGKLLSKCLILESLLCQFNSELN